MKNADLQPIKHFTRFNDLEFFHIAKNIRANAMAMLFVMSKGMVDQVFQTPDTLNKTFRDILGISEESVRQCFQELENMKVILKRTRHSVVLNPAFMNKHQELPGHLLQIVVNAAHTLEELRAMEKVIWLSDHNYRKGFTKTGETVLRKTVEELGKIYYLENLQKQTEQDDVYAELRRLKASQIEDGKTITALREELLKKDEIIESLLKGRRQA